MSFLRRYQRWIIVLFVFLLATHYLYKSAYQTPRAPRFQIIKSTYDWSRWQPYHPVESIQSLPNARPESLPKIQQIGRPGKFDVSVQSKRREKIRSVMAQCWSSYVEVAWMRDELTPVTKSGRNTFGGWAATLVDSLDTLWIMGMKDEFYHAVQGAVSLDWAVFQGGPACNFFETTIRYLGGLLSAYDLSGERSLLDKAIELGDMLYAGFDTPNHMPGFWFDFEKAKTGRLMADEHQAAASVTLQMEFTHLAQLTGNNKYYDAVARVTDNLFVAQNLTKIPGMWPTYFELRSGILTANGIFTLGASSDSMYEYILKTYMLLGATEPKYEQMYRTAADTIIQHIVFRPMTPENLDILFTGTYYSDGHHDGRLVHEGQHLACFAGGMFAIGGKIFNIPEHVAVGEKLTKGCIWAYDVSHHGIMPEIFKLIACETTAGCAWNETAWLSARTAQNIPKGFESVRDPKYILRPEAIESVFILYRITGDEYYREAAWRMFEAIQKVTETPYGNSAVMDVTVDKVYQVDSMEVSCSLHS